MDSTGPWDWWHCFGKKRRGVSGRGRDRRKKRGGVKVVLKRTVKTQIRSLIKDEPVSSQPLSLNHMLQIFVSLIGSIALFPSSSALGENKNNAAATSKKIMTNQSLRRGIIDAFGSNVTFNTQEGRSVWVQPMQLFHVWSLKSPPWVCLFVQLEQWF